MSKSEKRNQTRSKPSRNLRTNHKTPEFNFVRCKLSAEDRRAIADLTVSESELFLWLSEQVEAGFKVSLVMDDEHDRYICSLTGKKSSGEAWNRCLSASGPDIEGAMACAYYKFTVKLQGEMWRDAEESAEESKYE